MDKTKERLIFKIKNNHIQGIDTTVCLSKCGSLSTPTICKKVSVKYDDVGTARTNGNYNE